MEIEIFLREVLKDFQVQDTKIVDNTVIKLLDNLKVNDLAKRIKNLKTEVLEVFTMYKEKEEFKEEYFIIPNANSKKGYEYILDLQHFPNIHISEIKNLEYVGLEYDVEAKKIFGTPTVANTIELQIVFYHQKDENKSKDHKIIPFIVNADPKDLWKDLPSDKNSMYAKDDHESLVDSFLDKKLVIGSKRGRSHAHEGSFRDDHFMTKKLPQEWQIIAIADGAGSAKYARQGSKIATEIICESFNNEAVLTDLNALVKLYFEVNKEELTLEGEQRIEQLNSGDGNVEVVDDNQDSNIVPQQDPRIKTKSAIINHILYKAVKNLHTSLNDFSKNENIALKDLNTTLIFVLAKKFDFGYVLLNFGVGDCPINVISENNEEIKLLNILDVGEYGGGTRFITMPEIFSNSLMAARFGINKMENFSKLFLMTDGIYDPKFVTENKLEDLETWKYFLEDLDGENEDNIKVDFVEDENIENQLMNWMDFWSKGNHDDRTLAIIY